MQLRLCQAGPGFWPGPLVPAEVAPATCSGGLGHYSAMPNSWWPLSVDQRSADS